MGAVKRGLKAFGHFWWDFLIGDTPELALATGVIVGWPSCSPAADGQVRSSCR